MQIYDFVRDYKDVGQRCSLARFTTKYFVKLCDIYISCTNQNDCLIVKGGHLPFENAFDGDDVQ